MDAADLIRAAENLRLQSYDDSSGHTLEVGDRCYGTCSIAWGATGPDVNPGDIWTRAQCDARLASDMATAEIAAMRAVGPAWSNLNDARQAAMIDAAYELGERGLAGFVKTLGALRRGDYESAARLMLASKWAGQVPSRAKRDAEIIRTGSWPASAEP